MRLWRFLVLIALSSCAETFQDEGGLKSDVVAPRTLDAVIDRYDSLVGRRIAVDGFLVLTPRNHLLVKGARKPADGMDGAEDEDAWAGYWCTYFQQPEPLEVK